MVFQDYFSRKSSSPVCHLLCKSHTLPKGTDDFCVCILQVDQHVVDL